MLSTRACCLPTSPAKLYVNTLTQYQNDLHCCEDNVAGAAKEAIAAADLFITGCFVMRDGGGNVADRVTSDVVRDFEDIHTVDPIWVQHRVPDTAHIEAETTE